MWVNNLPKVATQWNSGATRDWNRGHRARMLSALTTKPFSFGNTQMFCTAVTIVAVIKLCSLLIAVYWQKWHWNKTRESCFPRTVSNVMQHTAKPVSRSLGLTQRIIKFENQSVLIPFYKHMVRPHSEYSSVVWSPHYVKDIVLLEQESSSALPLCFLNWNWC